MSVVVVVVVKMEELALVYYSVNINAHKQGLSWNQLSIPSKVFEETDYCA